MIKTRQVILLSAAILAASILPAAAQSQASSTKTVIASGLQSPRGLKFGPDGMLYVAEAGTGGTNSTVGTCPQVPPPVGPYKGGRMPASLASIKPAIGPQLPQDSHHQ